MKFKALAASFLTSAALAGCGSAPSTPEEAAASRAQAEATAYDVTCRDNSGNITFEGASSEGLTFESSSARHIVVETLDGRSFEQYGGTCAALKRTR